MITILQGAVTYSLRACVFGVLATHDADERVDQPRGEKRESAEKTEHGERAHTLNISKAPDFVACLVSRIRGCASPKLL